MKPTKDIIKDILQNKRAETKNYVGYILQRLEDEEGFVDDTYIGSLRVLAESYDMILKCREQMGDEYTVMGKLGVPIKNPLYDIIYKAEKTVLSIVDSYGLDVKSKNRIKKLKKENGADVTEESSPLDEFLNS